MQKTLSNESPTIGETTKFNFKENNQIKNPEKTEHVIFLSKMIELKTGK